MTQLFIPSISWYLVIGYKGDSIAIFDVILFKIHVPTTTHRDSTDHNHMYQTN